MSDTSVSVEPQNEPRHAPLAVLGLAGLLVAVIFRDEFRLMYENWSMEGSYYSHGFLVPPISAFFAWRQREALAATPVRPEPVGIALTALSCVGIVMSVFIGYGVLIQLALLPLLTGLVLAVAGWAHVRLLWFPIAFLFFMIPIPQSVTTDLALYSKLFATDFAVDICRYLGFPMIRDGSFVHFRGDRLLVGDECSGLRSLVALIAFGSIMAYISKTNLLGRLILLALCAPIAIVSNILRIMFLCIISFYYGSQAATGLIHDGSGMGIFVVAFVCMFAAEGLLRKVLPAKEASDA